MAYAKTTKVPVRQTKGEIEKTVDKYGADNFGIMRQGEAHIVAFTVNGRNIMFRVNRREDAQEERSIWRALSMSIKMKLESVEAGIETFDEAFLAQIVAPDGMTYGDHMIPKITETYENRSVPLLPNFTN